MPREMAAFDPPSAHFCGSDGGSEEAAGVRQGRLASVAGGQARAQGGGADGERGQKGRRRALARARTRPAGGGGDG